MSPESPLPPRRWRKGEGEGKCDDDDVDDEGDGEGGGDDGLKMDEEEVCKMVVWWIERDIFVIAVFSFSL